VCALFRVDGCLILAVKETNVKTVRALGVSWKRFSMLMQIIKGKSQGCYSAKCSVCMTIYYTHTHTHACIYILIKLSMQV